MHLNVDLDDYHLVDHDVLLDLRVKCILVNDHMLHLLLLLLLLQVQLMHVSIS
jgi:hypothetical protein